MNVRICAVGRLKLGPLRDLYGEYIKRLPWPVEAREFTEPAGDSPAERRARSAENLLSAAQGYVIALDSGGKTMDSRAFSRSLESWFKHGRGRISFLIGGADGLDAGVIDRADGTLSFGAMTWPHLLARVMLAEQLCRADAIQRGHPYHREG